MGCDRCVLREEALYCGDDIEGLRPLIHGCDRPGEADERLGGRDHHQSIGAIVEGDLQWTCLSQRREFASHDFPLGNGVELRITARRFVCTASHCQQRIFAERFGEGLFGMRARRTTRLEVLVRHLDLALGGRPAANFARRLMLPVSNDTLLRVVRRHARSPTEALVIMGVDDWAFRRNHRYGTIVCDLERHRVVKLLPDRDAATVKAFLARHPTIRVLSRDRGAGYGEAGAQALPDALQVADRWHLIENASAAFLDVVRKSMRAIRGTIGATTISPRLLTAAERLQYDGYLRREDDNAAILALHREGVSIKDIVRRLGHSRGLVRKVVRGMRTDLFFTKVSTLEPFLPVLDEAWTGGCRNGAELWRHLQLRGFGGSLRVVTEWATRRRRAEQNSHQGMQKNPICPDDRPPDDNRS